MQYPEIVSLREKGFSLRSDAEISIDLGERCRACGKAYEMEICFPRNLEIVHADTYDEAVDAANEKLYAFLVDILENCYDVKNAGETLAEYIRQGSLPNCNRVGL